MTKQQASCNIYQLRLNIRVIFYYQNQSISVQFIGPADGKPVDDFAYTTMVECSEKIIGGLSKDPKELADAFHSKGFIAPSVVDKIRQVPATNTENARSLFYPILHVIQHHPQRYENFLAVFEENPTLYGDVLATLKDTYHRKRLVGSILCMVALFFSLRYTYIIFIIT